MKVLVTGGAGFIGSHLVDRLIKFGYKVVVVDDLSAGKEENIEQHFDNKQFEFHQKSITDDLAELFGQGQFEVVFHLAAKPRVQYSIEYPVLTHQVNVDGTLNLLELSRHHKVKRFVFTSSSSVYGDQEVLPAVESMTPEPISPYALQKLVGEQYCKLFYQLYRLETVSLRYFNVYGARQNPAGNYACVIPKFITKIKNNIQPVINGDGEQTRDFTYVGDVAEANIKAAVCDNEAALGEVFNIGGGSNISINQLTGQIVSLAGSDLKPGYGPAVIEPRDSLADVSKAKDLLNWQPQVVFEDGMQMTYNFFH